MIDPPYPADLEAKGWCLDYDYERIEQSDTWAIATPEQRPWLLMLWLISWRQVPVASLPNDDRLIAARIGMPVQQFTDWREILLSGWQLATDGRMYHETLTQHALRMAEKRVKDRSRVAAYRARLLQSSDDVTRYTPVSNADVRVSSTPSPSPSLTPTEESKADARKSRPTDRGTRLPDDWKPSEQDVIFCVHEKPYLDPKAVAARFADHWHAQPGLKGRKTDWSATWRNWVRNEQPIRGSPANGLSKQALLEKRNAEAGREAKRMLFGEENAVQ